MTAQLPEGVIAIFIVGDPLNPHQESQTTRLFGAMYRNVDNHPTNLMKHLYAIELSEQSGEAPFLFEVFKGEPRLNLVHAEVAETSTVHLCATWGKYAAEVPIPAGRAMVPGLVRHHLLLIAESRDGARKAAAQWPADMSQTLIAKAHRAVGPTSF